MDDVAARYDLLVIGGGINGAGIARDAAGRGLKVLLVEQSDLAAATSSCSSKLIHGGLRYLEQYNFRLVAEALAEREVLLNIAPHLVEPLRFVMPYVSGLRPRWMIRVGLFLYDNLARRTRLRGSHGLKLGASPYGQGLNGRFSHAFVYSDCRVDDARLVLANAVSARECGARIETRTACVAAQRAAGEWRVELRAFGGAQRAVAARAIVNAAGPWVQQVLNQRLHQESGHQIKLVKGSHIVVRRAYSGEHAFILQNDDRRVVFLIPYEQDYTLIGTTEEVLDGGPAAVEASAGEIDYLCRVANRYLAQPITAAQVVWSYAGIRPLYDDGTANPSAITRDYTLELDAGSGAMAPVLSVYGGKITTYRRLAEHALAQLAPWFPGMQRAWTSTRPLPGGELGGASYTEFAAIRLKRDFPWLPEPARQALARRHGAYVYRVLDQARTAADLGRHFGAGLYAREVDYMMDHEWACCADDVLWRRSKAGLHLSDSECAALATYVERRVRAATNLDMR